MSAADIIVGKLGTPPDPVPTLTQVDWSDSDRAADKTVGEWIRADKTVGSASPTNPAVVALQPPPPLP